MRVLFDRLCCPPDDFVVLSLSSPVGFWVALWSRSGDGLVSLSYVGSTPPTSCGALPRSLASAWEEHWSGGSPSLRLLGSPRPFDLEVYRAVLDVPWGGLVTYGDLARRLGTSPRAVGSALRRNPWPLFVPCHRVVGKGGLGGYMGAGGEGLKGALLEFEASNPRGSPRP